MPVCHQDRPVLSEVEPQRWTACHLYPDHIETIDKGGNGAASPPSAAAEDAG